MTFPARTSVLIVTERDEREATDAAAVTGRPPVRYPYPG
jgi:hypothetical protein